MAFTSGADVLSSDHIEKALLDQINKKVWGPLGNPPGFKTRVQRFDSPSMMTRGFWIEVEVEGRARVGTRVEFSHLALSRLSATDLGQALKNQVIGGMLKNFPPRLYEYDPRKGTARIVGNICDEVLACPIIDPPPGVRNPLVFVDTKDLWNHCATCDVGFSHGEVVYWRGGFLLWGCALCTHG